LNNELAHNFSAKHFLWQEKGKVAFLTLNRPEKKNPLTFESYAELRDTFRALRHTSRIKVVVISGAGGNFCSGGDVHEIIGPLVKMDTAGLNKFTEMTGDLIIAMRACPQIIISAIDGICVGAGACIAMASDLRLGSEASKVAFLFVRVGLAGCDMGACSILPRIVGHGRASELLYTGRSMHAEEALRFGFYSKVVSSGTLLDEAETLAEKIATGPTLAHALTKRMLNEEWDIGIEDAVFAEARAQAGCMESNDFRRAYEAFVAKREPEFKGD